MKICKRLFTLCDMFIHPISIQTLKRGSVNKKVRYAQDRNGLDYCLDGHHYLAKCILTQLNIFDKLMSCQNEFDLAHLKGANIDYKIKFDSIGKSIKTRVNREEVKKITMKDADFFSLTSNCFMNFDEVSFGTTAIPLIKTDEELFKIKKEMQKYFKNPALRLENKVLKADNLYETIKNLLKQGFLKKILIQTDIGVNYTNPDSFNLYIWGDKKIKTIIPSVRSVEERTSKDFFNSLEKDIEWMSRNYTPKIEIKEYTLRIYSNYYEYLNNL